MLNTYVVEMGINAFKRSLPKISWKFCLQPRLNPSFCGPSANIGARNDSKSIIDLNENMVMTNKSSYQVSYDFLRLNIDGRRIATIR